MMLETENISEKRHQREQRATMQQMTASDPNFSVWVEASAGTGKTKVLSDRVLRLLLNKVNPMRILCLTYTKAAAVEMSNRISDRLSQWAVLPDSELEKDLKKLLPDNQYTSEELQQYKNMARTLFAILLDTPGGIKIQTIHSFCQEILKRFPLEAGITPYFDILDDVDSAMVLKQIGNELILESQDSALEIYQNMQYLTWHMKENSFAEAMKIITDNRNKITQIMRRFGGLNAFLKQLETTLNVRSDSSIEQIQAQLMQEIDRDETALNIAALLHGTKTDVDRAAILQGVLESGCVAQDFSKYKNIFLTGDNIRKTQATKNAQNFDENVSARMQKEAFRIYDAVCLCRKTELYQSTKAIFTIAGALNEKYENLKHQRSKLDYDDLILLTGNLLSNPSVSSWVLFKLDGGIDHILLDEAQDTSPAQWKIIKYLSEEFFAGSGSRQNTRTVFAVGDRKQSIYSFQGADPEKFDEMARYFAEKAGDNFKRVNLEVSFRSTAAILEMVNQLFSKEDVARGVVAENEKAQHLPSRVGEFGRVELWPLLFAENDDDKKINAGVSLPPSEMKHKAFVSAKLAQAIALKIKNMVDESHQNSHQKPLHYRDFMVLVQRRLSFVMEFVRACKEAGVNISGVDKLKLSEQIAVQDLISLGKFLLLPNDDLALAEVLKSPLFGLTDDDLLELCYGRKGALLWSKLGDNPKYVDVYQQLQSLAEMLDFVRPYELYNYVLTNMNGRVKFVERMGVDVEDALDEFMNLTISFERNNVPSLQNFVAWMSKNEIDIKRENEQSDADAVRIMTVHGSKGLQSPVVFLPDTVSLKLDSREMSLLYSKNEAYFPLGSACYEENCEAIVEENNRKSMEEYRRLLYVALTRAKNQLFICGYSNKKEESVSDSSWYKLCRQTLKEIAEEQGDNLVLECPESIAQPSSSESQKEENTYPIENWVYLNAREETLLSKPYRPSKIQNDEGELDSSSPLQDNGRFYRRGTIIHKMLQFLPYNNDDMEDIVAEFLKKEAADFTAYQQEQIKQEVLGLLRHPDFRELFGKHAKSEVPVIGEIDGKIISAQIDKLVVLPDKIMVVDYKTNRPAAKDIADTPAAYLKQLEIYARLIERIYPNLPVEGYILWTNEMRLMRVF